MSDKKIIINKAAIQFSFLMCCLINVLFTIIKETNLGFKESLNKFLFNSWLAQLLMMIVLFVFLTIISNSLLKNKTINFNKLLPVVIILSVMILFVYYSFRTADTYDSAIVFNWLVVICLQYFAGLYHVESVLRPFQVFNRVVISVITSFALMLAAAFSVKVSDDISRLWVVIFFLSSVVSLALTKTLVAKSISLLEGRDLIARSVLIFGDRNYVKAMLVHIKETKPRFVAVKGVFDAKMIGPDGPLAEYGLVPSPDAERQKLQEDVKAAKAM